jgi:8-oxo-dGTP diphosphatase
MADQVKVRVSVLIAKDNSILLEKRHNVLGAGTWAPPTGQPDFGERPEQTAIRETQEETGTTISNVKFRAITNDIFEAEHEHYVTIWLDANYVSGQPTVKAPEEESAVVWFSWDALPEPLFLPFAHLIAGKTYPSAAAKDTVGAASELSELPLTEDKQK